MTKKNQPPYHNTDHDDAATSTFHIGKTGNRYHAPGCRNLGPESTEIPASQAVAEGRKACRACRPQPPDFGEVDGVPIAATIRDEYGRVIAYCPYCGGRHVHGEGGGLRTAHCSGGAGLQYVLVPKGGVR